MEADIPLGLLTSEQVAEALGCEVAHVNTLGRYSQAARRETGPLLAVPCGRFGAVSGRAGNS